MRQPYNPVDCAAYARYERAIVLRRRVVLVWVDHSGMRHLARVRPLDLETCSGEEFLHFAAPGGTRGRVRLDRILVFRE